jgi:hypothetical protein
MDSYAISCNTRVLTLFLATHGLSHYLLQHINSQSLTLLLQQDSCNISCNTWTLTLSLATYRIPHYSLQTWTLTLSLVTHGLYTFSWSTWILTPFLATHGLSHFLWQHKNSMYTISCKIWTLTLSLATHCLSHHPLQHKDFQTRQLYKVTHNVMLTCLLTYGLLTASLVTQKNSRAALLGQLYKVTYFAKSWTFAL